MDFLEGDETAMTNAAVARIAAGFGPVSYRLKVAAGEKAAELWEALGSAGFMGVSRREENGGGGGGTSTLAVVCAGTAAAGCSLQPFLVSSAIGREVIRGFAKGTNHDIPGVDEAPQMLVAGPTVLLMP
jgi:alkylation response protein AidB-like acyl-CoA dehydrogenase